MNFALAQDTRIGGRRVNQDRLGYWSTPGSMLMAVADGRRRLVISAIEHPSVLETARHLESQGFALTIVAPEANGIVEVPVPKNEPVLGFVPGSRERAELADSVEIPVIVSGGIRSAQDVLDAAAQAGRGIAGAIVGRALYTGDLDLGATLEQLACS